MRLLTEAQLERVYREVHAEGLTHGTLEDLDDLWLDGRFSLVELRRLVDALTICEQECTAQPLESSD